MQSNDSVFLALDVGRSRIGVARATSLTRLPSPLKTVQHTPRVFEELKEVAREQLATVLVVGLPRSLEGNDTAQTAETRAFARRLENTLELPVYLQDEALTSQKAEEELRARGVPYNKAEVDALAATYILSDFLGDHPEV